MADLYERPARNRGWCGSALQRDQRQRDLHSDLPDLADASLSDLVIIGGPVHNFAADPVIRAAIRQIPGLDRKRVVLFATDTSPLDPFGGKRALSQMGEELQSRSCRLMHSAVIYWNKKTRDSQIEELKHALKKIYG